MIHQYKVGDRVYVMPEAHRANWTSLEYCGKVCEIKMIDGQSVWLGPVGAVRVEYLVPEHLYNSPLYKALS
jgi:hypothetical protein